MANYKYVSNGKARLFDEIPHQRPSKQISVIIPTYNEEGNIERLLTRIEKAIKPSALPFEIIVVDDNSKDKTPQIIDEQSKKGIVVALHRLTKRGIFSAIRDGVKASRGNYIVIMDADFSHPPEKISSFLEYIPDYDLIIGSRFVKGAGIEAPFFRHYGTIILNLVCRTIIGLKPKDISGGFHLMKKSLFQSLKFKYPAIWGEFDMELVYRAAKKKAKIKEIPFVYKFREEGKSKSENLIKYGYVYAKRALELRLFG